MQRTVFFSLLAVALAASLSSCSRSCSSQQEPVPDLAATTRSCADILAEMDNAVTSGSTACDGDDDCACFNLPYKPGTCGVAVTKETNGNLVALTVEAKASGCDLPRPCPDWDCTPHCDQRPGLDGVCTHLGPCARLSERFEEVLASGNGKCENDEGCGVYRAGVGHNCGGVTDAKTAAELTTISERFFAAKCDYVVHCAPRAAFSPRCRNGVCVDGNQTSSNSSEVVEPRDPS